MIKLSSSLAIMSAHIVTQSQLMTAQRTWFAPLVMRLTSRVSRASTSAPSLFLPEEFAGKHVAGEFVGVTFCARF